MNTDLQQMMFFMELAGLALDGRHPAIHITHVLSQRAIQHSTIPNRIRQERWAVSVDFHDHRLL
jgi:hypothetical protein